MTEPRDSEPPGRGPYDGAMADEDEALQVAEILAHTGAVGPDGPGTAPMLSDLAVLVAAEVDHHDTARPLPGPLHRLRTDTVGLLRRAPAPYDLHDRVNRKAALALLLLHSGGPGPHRVRGAAGATARLAECLEALHLLESAHEEAREASAAEPDYRDERALRPGELLDWALWAHTEIDGVLTYALEFRPERPSAVPTPLSAPLRKLAASSGCGASTSSPTPGRRPRPTTAASVGGPGRRPRGHRTGAADGRRHADGLRGGGTRAQPLPTGAGGGGFPRHWRVNCACWRHGSRSSGSWNTVSPTRPRGAPTSQS